jgi:hypothetical protein
VQASNLLPLPASLCLPTTACLLVLPLPPRSSLISSACLSAFAHQPLPATADQPVPHCLPASFCLPMTPCICIPVSASACLSMPACCLPLLVLQCLPLPPSAPVSTFLPAYYCITSSTCFDTSAPNWPPISARLLLPDCLPSCISACLPVLLYLSPWRWLGMIQNMSVIMWYKILIKCIYLAFNRKWQNTLTMQNITTTNSILASILYAINAQNL